jgi:hypothetical protein
LVDIEISSLPNLQTLSLKFNQLCSPPSHLARLYPHLKSLLLEGNPCYRELLPMSSSSNANCVGSCSTRVVRTRRRMPLDPHLRHAKSTPDLVSLLPPSPKTLPQRVESLSCVQPSPHNRAFSGVTNPFSKNIGLILTKGRLVSNYKSARNETPLEGSDSSRRGHTCYGVHEATFDLTKLTITILSRLRDVWELSNREVIIQDSELRGTTERLNESRMDLSIKDSVETTVKRSYLKGLKIVQELVDTEETYTRLLQEVVAVQFSVNVTYGRFTSITPVDLFLPHWNLI